MVGVGTILPVVMLIVADVSIFWKMKVIICTLVTSSKGLYKLRLICEWYDITNLFFEFKELSAGVNRASRAYNLKSVSRHDFEDVADDEYDAAVKGNHNPDIFLKYWLN